MTSLKCDIVWRGRRYKTWAGFTRGVKAKYDNAALFVPPGEVRVRGNSGSLDVKDEETGWWSRHSLKVQEDGSWAVQDWGYMTQIPTASQKADAKRRLKAKKRSRKSTGKKRPPGSK